MLMVLSTCVSMTFLDAALLGGETISWDAGKMAMERRCCLLLPANITLIVIGQITLV